MVTNAGCVMRKSAARETEILSLTFTLLSEEHNAASVCLYVHLHACMCVSMRKYISVHMLAHLCVLRIKCFQKAWCCYTAAGKLLLQSCPSGSPDWISKH